MQFYQNTFFFKQTVLSKCLYNKNGGFYMPGISQHVRSEADLTALHKNQED